jgi:hypothetical protein
MRVTRNENGSFNVEDEPMRVEGPAAERFLDDMAARDRSGGDGDRRQFLDDCRRTYTDARDRFRLSA